LARFGSGDDRIALGQPEYCRHVGKFGNKGANRLGGLVDLSLGVAHDKGERPAEHAAAVGVLDEELGATGRRDVERAPISGQSVNRAEAHRLVASREGATDIDGSR